MRVGAAGRIARRHSVEVSAGVGSFAVLVLCWVLGWAFRGTPLAFFRPSDDAYYAFDLASSVARGCGLTVDCLHVTNGFHPLWLLVLLPFGVVARHDPQALVVIAQFLSFVCFGVAVSAIAIAGRESGLSRYSSLAGALLLWFAPWRNIVGAVLEGGITLALLCLLTLAVVRFTASVQERPPPIRSAVLVGTLAGLTILARLDSAWVVGCLGLVSASAVRGAERRTGRASPRAYLALAAPAAILVGSYLVANVVFFGEPVPISGTVKSSFPEPDPSLDYLRSFAPYLLALAVAWLGLGAAWRFRIGERRVLAALAVGGAVQWGYVMMFSPRGVFWWHFVSVVPGALYGGSVIIEAVLRRLAAGTATLVVRWSMAVALGLALVIPLVSSFYDRDSSGEYLVESGWRVEAQRAGEWATENLPADAMLAMRDSGAFGYYADQPVMNLDGVISSFEYQRRLCSGQLPDELEEAGVRYVAYHALRESGGYTGFGLPVACRLAGDETYLRFDREDEVYRSEPYDHGGRAFFVIWRYDDP